MALLLFRDFMDLMRAAQKSVDIDIFDIMVSNFQGNYKKCSLDAQGRFHELVAEYMKA